MESAIRYDFSFPPKSASLNTKNLHSVQPLSVNNTIPNGITHHMNTSSSNTPSHMHHLTHCNNNLSNNTNNTNNSTNNLQREQSYQPNENYSNNLNSSNTANLVGLTKSASSSLLTCAASHNNNNNNNNNCKSNYCTSCNTVKDCNIVNNNNTTVNNLNLNKSNQKGNMYQQQASHGHHGCKTNPSHFTIPLHQNSHPGSNNGVNHSYGGPATPKDANCSFTFDELKNTLAFMEDSPLINTNQNSNNNENGITSTSNPSTVLMVIPNANPDCGSSVSSLSSSSSSSGSSSCNSCCTNNYIPKSNSNPMLLSNSSSSSSSSNNSTSPISTQQIPMKSEDCSCVSNMSGGMNLNHQPYETNPNTILDLLIKKPESSVDINHDSYSSSSNGNNSLITTATSLNLSSNNMFTGVPPINIVNNAIESAAKKYRCAAQISEATCCWKGKLPPKQYKTPIVYSTKVFVGGLPWDITEEDIVKEFGVFGPCRVEWTNKEKFNLLSNGIQVQQVDLSYNGQQNNSNNQYGYQGSSSRRQSTSSLQSNGKQNMSNSSNVNNQNSNGGQNGQNNDPLNSSKHRLSPGFAYVIYDSEYSVRSLVGNCIEDYQNGRDRVEYYFKISTRRVRNKEVQIIPWILADNNFALCTPKELDPKKTVFVGNLHGTMTARDLAHIMNELFGCVVYAGIDIDKLKYPIGSGRVTFSHHQNFMRAVRAAFVDIQASKFSKRIQIDPYLEDVECCICYSDKGIYFCRDFQCFNYYCGHCWEKQHSYNQMGNHKPLMRKREDKI